MTGPRHFQEVDQVAADELHQLLDTARTVKAARQGWPRGRGDADLPLAGCLLVALFEKPSTRTRVSFDVAMRQLGGQTIVIDAKSAQISRGESIADTARVLSGYADAIMFRTDDHARFEEMCRHAQVPVINGLTDQSHPCQLMADIMTIDEEMAGIAGKTITWVGDGNNMANSWIRGAAIFGYRLRLSCPEALNVDSEIVIAARAAGAEIELITDPAQAVDGSDVVVTDTWVSMHDDGEGSRHNLLKPYQVNADIMAAAGPQARFLHCLPAHRGEEVTDAVMDGTQSLVWEQAENRVHAQKGILLWCLNRLPS